MSSYNNSNNIAGSTADESDNWRTRRSDPTMNQPSNSKWKSNSRRYGDFNNNSNHNSHYNNYYNNRNRSYNSNVSNNGSGSQFVSSAEQEPPVQRNQNDARYEQIQYISNINTKKEYITPYNINSNNSWDSSAQSNITRYNVNSDNGMNGLAQYDTTQYTNAETSNAQPVQWKKYSKEHSSPEIPNDMPSQQEAIERYGWNSTYNTSADVESASNLNEHSTYDKPKSQPHFTVAYRSGQSKLKERRKIETRKEQKKNVVAKELDANNWRSTATSLRSLKSKEYLHADDRNSSKRRTKFKPFISPDEIEAGIKEGTLYQGVMRISRNRNDAYVTVDDLDADIYVGGFADRNRSLQGDMVAVKLLDVDQVWNLRKEREAKRMQNKLLNRQKEQDQGKENTEEDSDPAVDDDANVDEETEETNDDDEFKPKYCGEVVGIITRPPNSTFVGYISAKRFNNDNDNIAPGENNKPKDDLRMAWFRPTDKRVPLLTLRNYDIPTDLQENEEYYKTHLFVADIRRWQICDSFPTGRIVKELGPVGDLMTEREAILADNNIIDREFSDVALRGLPELPWSIPESEFEKRRDLRSERVFSIDPITAKDLDDALHIKELGDGFYEVGVHIADVTYFLKQGSALDSEAKERGTSTYLVDSVVPMLPPILCEELCSLNPGVDRLAFSVIWKMDAYGKPVDTWFGKTVIRSCTKLAYENAQMVVEGDEMPEDIKIHDGHNLRLVSSDIFMLYKLSMDMRQRRYDNGSLSMNSIKLYFDLNEQGEPTSVHKFETKEANHLVEEFMLCANISVAQKITSAFPEEALLRKHEEPLERRLNEFLKLTDMLGLDFTGYNAGNLQTSFNKIHNKDVKDVLLVLAIRSMQRAKYFCSGTADITKYHHYALNEPLYTHFTSPIRRYADVIVHRLLQAALDNKESCGYPKKKVQRMAFACNTKKDGAKNAQDVNIQLYLARYLSNQELTKGPVYTKGDVIMVSKDYYEVYVPEYGLEKKFHIEDFPIEQHHFDKHTSTLEIFWKRGVPVTMHNEEKIYAQERVRKDDYSDEELEDEEELAEVLDSLTMKKKPHEKIVNDDDLIPPTVLEPNTCMQRLKMFSSIDIRLQVNIDRSPPIINIYPVNPFSEETIKY